MKHHHSRRRGLVLRLFLRLIRLLFESVILALLLYLLTVLIKPEPQVGVVKGNVLLGTEPVDGVTMTLVKDDVIAASAITGSDGKFEFDPVAIGVYTLNAHKDIPEGYLTASTAVDVTGDGVVVSDLSLESGQWDERPYCSN